MCEVLGSVLGRIKKEYYKEHGIPVGVNVWLKSDRWFVVVYPSPLGTCLHRSRILKHSEFPNNEEGITRAIAHVLKEAA